MLFMVNIKDFKTLKYHNILQRTLVLSIICSKCSNKDEKIFKEEQSIEILKILGLINNTEQVQKYDKIKHKSRI